MHLAKHPRCGRHQSRIGLSSALDRPTVSAWAAVEPNGAHRRAVRALSITHAGVGTYNVTVTAASCRHASNNAPVVSVNDGEPPEGFGGNPALSRGVDGDGQHWVEAFTIHTGVVVNGAFQPRDESFNFTDSCG